MNCNSKRDNLLVENYHRLNLLMIRNLDDGSLKYNIRGDEPAIRNDTSS
ncbi:MAG: hypothetical protein ACI30I_09245 [Parabacteroides sp.]